MKNVEVVSLSLPKFLVNLIDKRRLDVSRSKYVQRLLEKAIEDSKFADAQVL